LTRIRHTTWAVSLAVVAAAVCSPSPAAATPAGLAGARCGATPVGTWDGTVQTSGDTHQSTFSFAANGKADIAFGGPGEVSGSGVGTWRATGPGHFAFRIRHSVLDPTGTLIGWVQVNQNAAQTGDMFSSSGISLIFAPDGTQTGTTEAAVSATRKSRNDQPCGRS